MELPGVKIVGKINLPTESIDSSHPIYYTTDDEDDNINEEIWEEEKRRFMWLQDMYAKGYTYEDLFGGYSG